MLGLSCVMTIVMFSYFKFTGQGLINQIDYFYDIIVFIYDLDPT